MVKVLTCQVWGPRLIAATGCAAELMAPAWSYLSVRALSAPSVLLLMVAQVSGLTSQIAHICMKEDYSIPATSRLIRRGITVSVSIHSN